MQAESPNVSTDLLLEGLNPAQREAVTHGDGPLLVVAGAGTGKTRTLACRVAYLIRHGVQPHRILLLTFTRRAAAQMLRRSGELSGRDAASGVWSGTFHAIAVRLLRIHGGSLNLPEDFTVMDQGDAADLMNMLRDERTSSNDRRRFPRKGTLVNIYSRMVNAQKPLDETLRVNFPWCRSEQAGIAEIFDNYVARKRAQHMLDFDDLLIFWSALCATPNTARQVGERFDHVLVDEYQDTNLVQAEILHGLRRDNKNIMVVGDDAQSIYSFRSATVRNILDFPDQFPDTHVVTLEENYRSTTPILAASNAIMEQATERYTKSLWSTKASEQKPVLYTCVDEPEQCDIVCRTILEHREQGTDLMHQAVLFRAGHHSAQLEIELARRNIPFRKYGGLKFVEAAHIKDMVAILRILQNPYDEISWFRTLQRLDGIGPGYARRIMDCVGVRPAHSSADKTSPGVSPLATLATNPPKVPPAAREQFAAFCKVLAECSGRPDRAEQHEARQDDRGDEDEPVELNLVTQVERIGQFYEPILDRSFDNAAVRLKDIEQLSNIAAGYRSRGRFITDLTLDPPQSTGDLAQPPHLDEDYLILSTIHSAKGCEWDVVQVIHAADGMIPSDMAVGDAAGVDEERRLFYVALTRAKNHLYVHFPLRYYHTKTPSGDAHSYAQLTRFLTPDALAFFEKRAAGEPEELDKRGIDGPPIDPYDRVSRLWRT